jgi:hypothetical protein
VEAEIAGVPPESASGTAREIFRAKLKKIEKGMPALHALLARHPFPLEKAVRMYPGELPNTGDAKLVVAPPKQACVGGNLRYIQLANFLITDNLLLSGKYWEHFALAEREKAAILLHEVIYRAVRREFGDQNSWRARHLVAMVFSSFPEKKLAGEVEATLRLPKEHFRVIGDEVPLFAVKTTCQAYVEDPKTARRVAEKTWSSREFGEDETFQLLNFSFRILTYDDNGMPGMLLIKDLASGASSELWSEDMQQALLLTKEVSLRLGINKPTRLVARLSCQVEDK